MLDRGTSMFNQIIIGYLISMCLLMLMSNPTIQGNASGVIDRCSQWNMSSRTRIFGRENRTAGSDAGALNLSYYSSGLEILRDSGEIVLLDGNNHRILVINTSNVSTLFVVLSDSSNLTNRSMIYNSPSAISQNNNNSIFIVDSWNKQFIEIPYPLQYGENATMINKSVSLNSTTGQNLYIGGLCVDPIDRSIFISYTNDHRIVCFNGSLPTYYNIYVGNGTPGNASNLLISPRSIVMNGNRTLFVIDSGNNRIQMFPFNSINGTTLPMERLDYIGLNLYSSNILIINTRNSVYLFNLTINQSRCIMGCSNSSQLNDTRNALIDNNGSLILTDSNQLVSFSMYSKCPDETSTITTNAMTSQMTTEAVTTQMVTARPQQNFVPNKCPPGQLGIGCTSKDDVCALNQPCLNSGSCALNSTNPRGYDCNCVAGVEGINCENDQRPCSQPLICFRQGDCVNTSLTGYRCDCYRGYEGDQCERMINFCANVTCLNRGVCSREFLNYTCNCLAGSYGRHCEITETGSVVRTYVRKSFGYIAIIMMVLVVGFIVVMDVLKYGFGIDPVKSERDALKRNKMEKETKKKKKDTRPKIAYRFEYIN